MSYSIFIASPTALIAQPGRAVNTFPSGLVRVDQVYLGLTSQAATHRATLAVGNNMPDGDSSPCIDGLKIFPEVQERRREDGFTEFVVSAYGRVKSTATIERKVKQCQLSWGAMVRGSVLVRVVSQTFPNFVFGQIPESYFDPISAFTENEQSTGFFQNGSGSAGGATYKSIRFTFPTVPQQSTRLLTPGFPFSAYPDSALFDDNSLILNFSSTNYGYWTEWIFSYD